MDCGGNGQDFGIKPVNTLSPVTISTADSAGLAETNRQTDKQIL